MTHTFKMVFDEELNTLACIMDNNPETLCIIEDIELPYADIRDLYEQIMDTLSKKLG